MPGIFNSKYFNAEVFGKYQETVPRVKQNAFLKAGIFNPRSDLKAMFTEQTGGNYALIPMNGRLDGTAPENYDGATDITASGITTFMQGMIVVGRAHGWTEKDFSFDQTQHDFMEEIGKQTSEYWDDVNQGLILSTLKGIFGISAFAATHLLDISGNTGDAAKVSATTLNDCIQQAAGANKNIFTLAIMHSQVATNLENLQLLKYAINTDENGIQRETALATWNGRTVLIDDDVPYDSSTGAYTTYVLGKGAFDQCDVGAKVPVETWRDPKTNGGEDYLYMRERVLYAPRGISFKQPSTAIVSPTNTQLETASNWQIVKDAAGSKTYDLKAIPIASIKSLG